MNRMIATLTAVALLALAPKASLAEADQPDATFNFSGGSVAAGIGYSWGHGTLHFKGKDYPFTANGLSVVNVGASSIDASGPVYHLTKVEDFPGTYTAATAGTTIAGGGSVSAMQNQNGVVLHVAATSRGLQFTLAPSGVSIAFEGPPTEMSGPSTQH